MGMESRISAEIELWLDIATTVVFLAFGQQWFVEDVGMACLSAVFLWELDISTQRFPFPLSAFRFSFPLLLLQAVQRLLAANE